MEANNINTALPSPKTNNTFQLGTPVLIALVAAAAVIAVLLIVILLMVRRRKELEERERNVRARNAGQKQNSTRKRIYTKNDTDG